MTNNARIHCTYVVCCSAFSNQTPVGDVWHAQELGSLHMQQRHVHSLLTPLTIGGTFYVVNNLTAQHGGRTTQRRHAAQQHIVCSQVNSIMAAYFDAPFSQGESQGAEKWQRLSLFLLRAVFETAEACIVSVQREDPNFFTYGDYFSCVRKTVCAQGRHTA